jgi:signal transduction histidine kinase
MGSFRDMPIKRKFTLIILLTSAVALLIACGAFGAYDVIMFRELMVRQLSTEADIIAANSTAAVKFEDKQAAEEILGALRVERGIEAACIYAKDGRVFATYERPDAAGTFAPPASRSDGYEFGGNRLELFRGIVLDAKPIGSLYLRSDLQALRARMGRYVGAVGVVMLAAFLFVLVLSGRLQRVVSEPILRLAQTARIVSHQRDYSVRAAKQGGDEVGQLIEAFNEMLTQIQKGDAALIRQSAELEKKNHELNEFAYIVSHDLKAPLRAINTLASWIATDYADKLDAEGQEQLSLLSARVTRMNSLIDGVLAYSRAGRIREEQTRIDVNALVHEVIELLASPATVAVRIDGVLPTLTGEPTRLHQVFQNLIGNAIKFLDKPDGEVRIGCTDDGSYWRFSVADNGPGIAPQYFDKIFQIFQTLSPRDERENTGIGLTVVKKIVEQWGGRVWIESVVGKGSTFFFTLPK